MSNHRGPGMRTQKELAAKVREEKERYRLPDDAVVDVEADALENE